MYLGSKKGRTRRVKDEGERRDENRERSEQVGEGEGIGAGARRSEGTGAVFLALLLEGHT